MVLNNAGLKFCQYNGKVKREIICSNATNHVVFTESWDGVNDKIWDISINDVLFSNLTTKMTIQYIGWAYPEFEQALIDNNLNLSGGSSQPAIIEIYNTGQTDVKIKITPKNNTSKTALSISNADNNSANLSSTGELTVCLKGQI